MHNYNFIFCAVFSLFSPVFSDGDYTQYRACCRFKGPGFEDIEYTIMNHFNKHPIMQYNSTRGNWIGFTAYSIRATVFWNSDPYDALQRIFEKRKLCIENIGLVQTLGNVSAIPTIRLNSVKHAAMLVCSAYNFYPKQIRVTWLQNGQKVTSTASSSEVMPDGDLYQVHSYLDIPTSGDTITCMVEHFTLSEPVLRVWDPSLPAPERIKIAVGLCSLMLGFVFVSSGFIYYKKKSAAYFALYQGRETIPVEHLPATGVT